MAKLIWIAMGGGAGALMRYALAGWGQKLTSGAFPVGTLIVNSLGCVVIGAMGAVFAGPHLVPEEARVGLLVGVLGAFTTMSTFGWETFALARDGDLRLAVLNVVLTNVLALVAVWVGYRVTERWFGA